MATTAAETRRALAGHTIWLWHYMHADWQWEQSRAWHEERYALAVGEALDLMRQDPEFRYFFDNASEFFEPVARRLGPRLEELRQRVREGRVRIASAQVANCRPNQVGDETFLRNLQLGRAFFQANLPPTDLSLFHSVDIAIGGSQMPQILRQAGFQYYRAWRPHGPLNVQGIPQQFLWEGADGSRILVTRGCYAGLHMSTELPPLEDSSWDAVVSTLYDRYFRDQLLAGRSPSGHLFLTHGNDDERPLYSHDGDRPMDILGLVTEWRRRETVPLRWCTPLEFSQAVAERAAELPVVRGALDGCDCGYNAANGGMHGLWHWRQMNDRRLLRAEWWSALANSAGYPDPGAELQRLWRQHLTYQAHAEEFAFAEDMDALVGLARDVQRQAERIEHDAQEAIARAAGGGGRQVQYVFNHHPWPVEADVELYHACPVAGVESLDAVDEQGAPLPCQTLAELRHPRFAGTINDSHLLVRVKLPPMGYRRVTIRESAARPAPCPAMPADGTLEAAGLRLTYGEHALRAVQDVASGATYAHPDGLPWPGLTFHEVEDPSWLFGGRTLRSEPFIPQNSAWLQTGPLCWQHRSTGMVGPYRAQIDTLLGARGRELQVRVRLEGNWAECPRAGFVTLAGHVGAGGQITVDVPFGVEDRDPDHEVYAGDVPKGQDLGITDMFERLRPGFFWARSWADWSGTGHGCTWISADGCYYWHKEHQAFGHVVLRCMRPTPGTWEERYGQHLAGGGVHTFSYAIHFHDGDWRAVDPQRRSAELHHPPTALRTTGETVPTLPAAHSFLELRGCALLSACYRDGHEAAVVRLYEHEGRGGEAILRLAWAPARASAVDLVGNVADVPLNVDGREVRVTLRPWQIVTLRLEA